ncbi:MAG: MotB family protein [Methylovirgula sp.]
MAEEKVHEIVIIKRSKSHGDGHHGGAWKIAFADFMTAMMALFLVLWLLSATNEKTKASLARYFNPVKLVDMTVQKRGLHDPKERSTEDADTEAPPPSKPGSQKKTDAKESVGERGAKSAKEAGKDGSAAEFQPTHSEGALFRDPYAVLAEIAAVGPGVKPQEKVDNPNVGAAARFQDPFQAGSPEVPQRAPPPAPSGTSDEVNPDDTGGATPANAPPLAPLAPPPPVQQVKPSATASAEPPPDGKPAAPVQQSAAKSPDTPSVPPAQGAPAVASKEAVAGEAASKTAAASASVAKKDAAPPKEEPKMSAAEQAQLVRLQAEIETAVGKSSEAPGIKLKATPQGLLISLTDEINYAMFAIGSAEPAPRTVQIMEKMAQILKKEPGKIVISGHTDARRYKTRNYDNWRLSQARAQMALYMLVRGGLDEARVEKIEGDADHDLKVQSDPLAAENRRIELLLRKTTP